MLLIGRGYGGGCGFGGGCGYGGGCLTWLLNKL